MCGLDLVYCVTRPFPFDFPSGFPSDFRYCSSRPASRRLSSAPFCPLANNATITSQSYHGESKGVSFDCFNGNCIVGYRGIYSRQKRFPPFSSLVMHVLRTVYAQFRAINRSSFARSQVLFGSRLCVVSRVQNYCIYFPKLFIY